MAKRTKHSDAEIAAKLAQASELQRQGKARSEIARALGISIMTLHRWRKMSPKAMPAPSPSLGRKVDRHSERSRRMLDLEQENARLRRLVTDLLLEKMGLEEALKSREPRGSRKHKASTARRGRKDVVG